MFIINAWIGAEIQVPLHDNQLRGSKLPGSSGARSPVSCANAECPDASKPKCTRRWCDQSREGAARHGDAHAALEPRAHPTATWVAPIKAKMREARLRWFGHVMRRDEVSVVLTAQLVEPAGQRPRGRPKKRWLDILNNEDMQAVNVVHRRLPRIVSGEKRSSNKRALRRSGNNAMTKKKFLHIIKKLIENVVDKGPKHELWFR